MSLSSHIEELKKKHTTLSEQVEQAVLLIILHQMELLLQLQVLV